MITSVSAAEVRDGSGRVHESVGQHLRAPASCAGERSPARAQVHPRATSSKRKFANAMPESGAIEVAAAGFLGRGSHPSRPKRHCAVGLQFDERGNEVYRPRC